MPSVVIEIGGRGLNIEWTKLGGRFRSSIIQQHFENKLTRFPITTFNSGCITEEILMIENIFFKLEE